MALGNATVSPINMANAYATIAGGGERSTVHVIEKVVDASGEERYAWKNDATRTVDEDIAADVSYALEGVVQSGSGTAALSLGRPAAGKTGTATNGLGEVSSAWFAGYTPQMATAVMYVRGKGNEQLEGWLPSYFGGAYPAETWTAIMTSIMEGLEVEEFPEPAYVDGDAPTDGHEPYVPPLHQPAAAADAQAHQVGDHQDPGAGPDGDAHADSNANSDADADPHADRDGAATDRDGPAAHGDGPAADGRTVASRVAVACPSLRPRGRSGMIRV